MISAYPHIAVAKEFKLVAAVSLGVIHRSIGLLGQGLHVLRIRRVDGDANAG